MGLSPGRGMDKRDEELYGLGKGLVEGMGYELVTVEDVVERGRRVFRFYVDHPRRITLDDCGTVSRELEYLLDAELDFDGAYVLEVSSPGLDHALKSEREFAYFIGRRARLVLREALNGRNVIVGSLVGAGSGEVRIESEDGAECAIPIAEISRARLVVSE